MKDYYLNGFKYWFDWHQRLWYYEDNEGELHFAYTKREIETLIRDEGE